MQLLLYTFAHILFSTVSYLSLQSYLIVLFFFFANFYNVVLI